VAKKRVAKKVVAKKAPAKKKAAPTATDQVLKIIGRFKKGVGVPAIKEKTGFDDKKVRNIVARAFKQGKIKRVGRGLYVGG
jgi:predicted transcriptional regulator of viral defense system